MRLMVQKIRTQITMGQLDRIIILTNKGYFRKAIANDVGLSTITVWKYQKKFDLI